MITLIIIPFNNWVLPLLALVPIVHGIYHAKKTKKVKGVPLFDFIIGFLVFITSVNDNYNKDDDKIRANEKTKKLQDTLRETRDTLLTVGLSINQKTGKILIIDSQLLKKSFTQVNNYTSVYSVKDHYREKQLNKFFNELGDRDNFKSDMALTYILGNFPDTLSPEQLKKIYSYVTSPINVSMPLLDRLSEQPASPKLDLLFKEIILKRNPTSYLSWEYLFKKREHADMRFILQVMQAYPKNSWELFRALINASLLASNNKVCLELLNSKELISFMTENKIANEPMQTNALVDTLMNRHSKMNELKSTYYFKTLNSD